MCKLICIKYLLVISTFTSVSFPNLSSGMTKPLTKQNSIDNILISQTKKKQRTTFSEFLCRIISRRGKCSKNSGSRR